MPYGSTPKWTPYSFQFTAKYNYNKLHVEIDFSKKGNAWFDDFELSKVSTTTN